MTAIWLNFPRFLETNPRTATPEAQARIEDLEEEVDRLKQLLKDREEEICARDQNLAYERRLKEKFKKEAQDAEARYVQVVEHMTEDLESQDNLEEELCAC
jgi:dsDNA-specific endonuclease/ATPase MutS2